jgi:hypothetical protein
MTDDVLQQLYRTHRHLAELQSMFQGADVGAGFDGTDPTGAVRTVLAADGLPTSFDVDYDWKRNLRPDVFGRAVTQAFQAASRKRLTALSQAAPNGVVMPEPADDPAPSDVDIERWIESALAASAGSATAAGGPLRRDPMEFLRAVLDATRDLDALVNAPPAHGTGIAGYGRLQLTLTRDGSVSCTADQSWVSDKTGEELTEALGSALSSAREDLINAATDGPMARLQRMNSEAMAMIRDATIR